MLKFLHGVVRFRHILLDLTASSWQTINAIKNLNGETNYSFTPQFA